MPEEMKNIYDTFEFPQDFEPKFSNTHVISHSPREFFITFGVLYPPRLKSSAIVQLVVTKEHIMELILNLQTQLKQFNDKQGGNKGNPNNPSRF